MGYKNLISPGSQEDTFSGGRSSPIEMTIDDQDRPMTSRRKYSRSLRRVGIQPKERRIDSFEEPSLASSSSSIDENDSIEETRDDEKGGARQGGKGSRERRWKSSKDKSGTLNLNKLEGFILNSGMLQLDERLRVKKTPLDASASGSSIELQPSDEIHALDRLDQRHPEKNSTGSLEKNTPFSVILNDEKQTMTQNVNNFDKIPNSHEQHVLEPDYDTIQIEGQPSVDSLYSITEKWERLLDGEGYIQSELKPLFWGQRSSDEILSLFESITKSPGDMNSPLNVHSGRPFRPLVLFAEKPIGEESRCLFEKINPKDDFQRFNEMKRRESDRGVSNQVTIGVEANSQPEMITPGDDFQRFDETNHRELNHNISEQIAPPEATEREGMQGAMAALYEFVDKLLTRTVAVTSKESDSSHSTESQMMNRARSNKSKTRKKNRKGRKKVRFDDEVKLFSPETSTYERVMSMFCCNPSRE